MGAATADADGAAAIAHGVVAAIAGLRPIVTESHDGLTFVVLGRRGPAAGGPPDNGTAFALPPGAVGVAVGLFDRLVAVESFGDADALTAAWPDLLAAAAEAWSREREEIRARRAPAPGRLRPDDGATDRLLRRATSALTAGGPASADARVAATPADAADAAGPADAAASTSAASAADANALAPGEVTIPIRGERVEGSALIADGRVVRLSIHRRESPDPPDGLVP